MARKHTASKHSTSHSAHKQTSRLARRNLTWLWIVLGVLVVALIVLLTLGRKSPANVAGPNAQSASASVEIQPAQAYAKYQQGAFFLDVRSQAEWDTFHIQGSRLIPLDQLQNRLSELPRNKDIVVVCLTGHRSVSGASLLLQAGFKQVSCLSGGMSAWVSAGYPVEGTPP